MSADVAVATASLEKPDEGCRWAEGPADFTAGRRLIWTDIPDDRIMRFVGISNSVRVIHPPAGHTNGNTLDRQGRLVACEHGNHRGSRTEHDGSTTTPESHHDGKRLNSLNDVLVISDGSVWFTDPAHGIDSDYKGH